MEEGLYKRCYVTRERHTMYLDVSGAGTADVNGTFFPYPGSLNGRPRYKHSTREVYIYHGPLREGNENAWFICNGPEVEGHTHHYYRNGSRRYGGASEEVPSTGWEKMSNGQIPGPTITKRHFNSANSRTLAHLLAPTGNSQKLSRNPSGLLIQAKKPDE